MIAFDKGNLTENLAYIAENDVILEAINRQLDKVRDRVEIREGTAVKQYQLPDCRSQTQVGTRDSHLAQVTLEDDTTYSARLLVRHRRLTLLEFLYRIYVEGFMCSQVKFKINSKSTVEPLLKDNPIGHKIMVSKDRWSLLTGSFTLKCLTFWQELMVLQDRWSLMVVVSQDRFHCISFVVGCRSKDPH